MTLTDSKGNTDMDNQDYTLWEMMEEIGHEAVPDIDDLFGDDDCTCADEDFVPLEREDGTIEYICYDENGEEVSSYTYS